MSPSTDRLLRFAGALVAVLLVALAFYPGTLAAPYVNATDPYGYTHTIVPESSSQYEYLTDETSPEVYRYEDLSPVARTMFDRTLAADPGRFTDGPSYVPQVCRDFMLVCDGYREREMPDEFTYGMRLAPEESAVFVEKGGERYLLQTGSDGHYFFGPLPFGFLTAWLALPPLAVLVALVVGKASADRVRWGVVALGALVAALAVLAPYLAFYGLAPVWVTRGLVLGAAWLTILGAGGYRLSGAVRARLGPERPDQS